ncbi:MAG: copper chaperone PCu(A)C [Betaproteobacteria bacterium]|nr:copper chaperone PCu(A)C [Betaproteobacteria bacterium]MBI3936439.1 copper chaperone PCu(A)C [Betaproteobacteria bacterium]
MRAMKNIDLPARRVVKLAPGGQHVMLLDVNRALKPGERVPLTLTIRSADGARSTVKIQAEVRSAADHGH